MKTIIAKVRMRLRKGPAILTFLLAITAQAGMTEAPPFTLQNGISQEKAGSLRWDESGPMDEQQAKRQMDERNQLLSDLLAPGKDPYYGTKSEPKACLPENLPTPRRTDRQTGPISYRSFYSSDHFVLGFCDGSKKNLKTQFLQFYCRSNRTLYRVRYFYDSTDAWLVKPVAQCK